MYANNAQYRLCSIDLKTVAFIDGLFIVECQWHFNMAWDYFSDHNK